MEKVIQKILDEAKEKVGGIEERAKEEADGILAEAKGKVSGIEGNAKKEAEERGRTEKERHLALARVEVRNSLLSVKRRLSEEVFEKALESLTHEKGYRGWMSSLLLQGVETGDEEVIVGNRETEMDQDFLLEVNEMIQKDGKKGNLRFSPERREIMGGFILRRERVETHASLEALFEGVRDELEVEVAKILFQ